MRFQLSILLGAAFHMARGRVVARAYNVGIGPGLPRRSL